VPTRDRGTATLGMMVAETLRRKTKTSEDDEDDGMSRLIWTSLKAARMEVVRSRAHRERDGRRYEARRVGKEIVDAVHCLDHVRPGLPGNSTSTTARLPSASRAVRTSSTELTTVATSPRRSGRPSGRRR